MAKEPAGKPKKLAAVASAEKGMVSFPETVFMMGCAPDSLEDRIRDLDGKKRLGIGNVLDATPPVWVHLDPFSITRRMVTNGEYAEFLQYTDEEGSFYDSPELWRHVWTDLGFHVQSVQMPFRASDGTVHFYEETYTACASFVDAYLQSVYHEIQCVFLGIPEERSEPKPDTGIGDIEDFDDRPSRSGPKAPRERVLKKVFAFVKHKLRDSIRGEDAVGPGVLTAEERSLLAEYTDAKSALADIDLIVRELRRGYGRQVDPRLQQAFKKGQVVVEPILLLERLAAAARSESDMESGVPLDLVLYPRRWRSPQGQARRRRLVGTAVPWSDCPVTGVSFFEALAYTAWLSSVTEKPLALPNEAQYERASSWPCEAPPVAGLPVKLNPRRKLLFPWQDHNPQDFNYFFGREGHEIEGYYQKGRRIYNELMESTARKLPEGEVLYQLEGFGWNWTCDRYSEMERKYSRFKDPDYPRYKKAPCIEAGGARAEVFHYVRNRSPTDSLVVLKGSPDVVGGPGLTTRRYAAYPLRGYFNTGFRLVCEETDR